jgi:hypothetical protein
MHALDAETDEQYTHSRIGSEHLGKLREESARRWETHHDEGGYPTTATDGQGRERRTRG